MVLLSPSYCQLGNLCCHALCLARDLVFEIRAQLRVTQGANILANAFQLSKERLARQTGPRQGSDPTFRDAQISFHHINLHILYCILCVLLDSSGRHSCNPIHKDLSLSDRNDWTHAGTAIAHWLRSR